MKKEKRPGARFTRAQKNRAEAEPPRLTKTAPSGDIRVARTAPVLPAAVDRLPVVRLHVNEDRRVRRGHLWVFSNEVEEFPADLAPGALVQFQTSRKEFLGVGFYNPHSLISGRLLERRPEAVDADFFVQRLRRAMDLRSALFSDDAYRWVFGESDDLPGLVIDRYGDVCVVESYCAGMDGLLPLIQEALMTIHPWEAVVLRNDAASRRLEHLTEDVRLLHGAVDAPHVFASDGLRLAADLLAGQKTGFFFDQRRNRAAVAALAKGKRVLDLFCHTGGFGLWSAAAGAAHVQGIDESEAALSLARTNAVQNGLAERMNFEAADVFDWMPKHSEKFDVVVLDPPRMAAAKKNLPNAVNAYVHLNTLALRRVTGGGFLATSSCSQHVDRETFRQIIARAAYESGRRVRIIFQGGQGPDHPLRPAMPETEYLKFAIAHVS